jgi:hypothetical protein
MADIAHVQAVEDYVQGLRARIARNLWAIPEIEAEKSTLEKKKGNFQFLEDWRERRKTTLEQCILDLEEGLVRLRRVEKEQSLLLKYLRTFRGGPWC